MNTNSRASSKRGLEEHGYAVDVAYDGEDGLAMATAAPYDVIVLDVMLPKLDGLAVCHALRAQQTHTPVLMLTARDAVDDRVSGLDSGDDSLATSDHSPSKSSNRRLRGRPGEARTLPVTMSANLSFGE